MILDSILDVRLMTVTRDSVTTSTTESPNLFWAICRWFQLWRCSWGYIPNLWPDIEPGHKRQPTPSIKSKFPNNAVLEVIWRWHARKALGYCLLRTSKSLGVLDSLFLILIIADSARLRYPCSLCWPTGRALDTPQHQSNSPLNQSIIAVPWNELYIQVSMFHQSAILSMMPTPMLTGAVPTSLTFQAPQPSLWSQKLQV